VVIGLSLTLVKKQAAVGLDFMIFVIGSHSWKLRLNLDRPAFLSSQDKDRINFDHDQPGCQQKS
jgi:hypothetical protein